MITIEFTGTSIENLIRQIVAFADKVDIKEGSGKRGRHEKKEAAGGDHGDLGKAQPE